MDEIWKPIPDTDYAVSNTGKVASMKWNRWRVLKPATNRHGYLQVVLCHGGAMTTRLVHTLIANAFLGEKPTPEAEVNHKNGARADNISENLEWLTPSENMKHSYQFLGRKSYAPRGQKSGQSKLTERDVLDIKRRLSAGESQYEIAKVFSVARPTIGHIAAGATWAWLK